jgi:hypothetical protein
MLLVINVCFVHFLVQWAHVYFCYSANSATYRPYSDTCTHQHSSPQRYNSRQTECTQIFFPFTSLSFSFNFPDVFLGIFHIKMLNYTQPIPSPPPPPPQRFRQRQGNRTRNSLSGSIVVWNCLCWSGHPKTRGCDTCRECVSGIRGGLSLSNASTWWGYLSKSKWNSAVTYLTVEWPDGGVSWQQTRYFKITKNLKVNK